MIGEDEPVARLEALVHEQAALRRVAVLVARDAEPAAIFQSVCEEVGCVLGVTTTNLVRYEESGTATVVGAWAEQGAPVFPLASDLPMDGDTVGPRIRRSGRTARVDDYTHFSDELAGRLRAVGIRSAVGAPIVVAGRLWGAVIAASARPYNLPANAETRISNFAQLITDALANADAREQLAASRARILKAGDEERRRLGRDLHDGAQQQLVSVVISLQLAKKRREHEPDRARELLDDALEHAQAAIGDLRELAAGIHPSVLTDRGLPAALETLAGRAPVPVELEAELEERLPSSVETTAYFVVAEALTNVGKYAHATRASVGVRVVGEQLEIEVLDDGVGGADPSAGSGLRGLADRVSALHGALDVSSPPGRGTRVHARIALNYAEALLAAGQREAAALPWGWSRFADGTPVPRMAGDLLAALGPEGERFRSDPLAAGPDSFRAWLASPVDGERPRITRLWAGVHAVRGDLRDAFPEPLGADRPAFARWIETDGAREHGVEPPPKRWWR